jgi:two-component system sensor histidine kinase KdpD
LISGCIKGEHEVVRIEDFGPGIPIGMEQAIFEKFERGNKENAIPGVGLGLTICRAIMQAHGGNITVFNKPEGGACFDLYFPLGTPPTEDGSKLVVG